MPALVMYVRSTCKHQQRCVFVTPFPAHTHTPSCAIQLINRHVRGSLLSGYEITLDICPKMSVKRRHAWLGVCVCVAVSLHA